MGIRKVQMMKKVVLAGMLTVVLAGAGCSQKAEETQIPATKVQTMAAARGDLEITGTYIGTVQAHDHVNVTPLVSGTVKSVKVKVGDQVKEGDVLCEFDDKAAQLGLESAKNALESAKAGKDAAKEQIDAAKDQAQASIDSMKSQLKSLKKQRKTSKKQLKKLKKSLKDLEKAQKAAAQGYQMAKKVYDSANTLFIQFQAFLAANPDCQTTAGLTVAALGDISQGNSADSGLAGVITSPDGVSSLKMIGDAAVTGTDTPDTGTLPDQPESETAETEDAQRQAQEAKEQAERLQKQETAKILLEELGKIPLTVEYLTEAGLNTLKDQVSQAQTASQTASAGYAEASSAVQTLKSGIATMNTQIKTLNENIETAEDAASKKTSTKAYDAQIKAAQTGVDSAQYQMDLYTVKAPIGGVVESVNVSENEIAAQGYPAFTIADKEAVVISFYVPGEVRDFLQTGNTVQVEGPAGEVAGSITSIASAVDPQKGLFKVEAEISSMEAKNFLSGSTASLSLVTNAVKGQILIPFDAVYYDNDQAYVFTARDGKAFRKDITAGPYNNEQIVILDGLTGGEEVIITWGAGLKDGAAIEIIGDTQ